MTDMSELQEQVSDGEGNPKRHVITDGTQVTDAGPEARAHAIREMDQRPPRAQRGKSKSDVEFAGWGEDASAADVVAWIREATDDDEREERKRIAAQNEKNREGGPRATVMQVADPDNA